METCLCAHVAPTASTCESWFDGNLGHVKKDCRKYARTLERRAHGGGRGDRNARDDRDDRRPTDALAATDVDNAVPTFVAKPWALAAITRCPLTPPSPPDHLVISM